MNELNLRGIERLQKTSDADGLELYRMSWWNPLRWIFLKRLRLMLDLFPQRERFNRLLEIGVGSGVLAPELSGRCRQYVAIDIHPNLPRVRRALGDVVPTAGLVNANVCCMPFADGSFDAIFALSVLEHVREIDDAVSELGRVLAPGGSLFVGFPIENFASNAVLDVVKLFIGFDRKVHHPTNHRQILSALKKSMERVTERSYPWRNRVEGSMFYVAQWTR